MKRTTSLSLACSPRFGVRTVLLALLLVAGLVFGVVSFAPAAHAASASRTAVTIPDGSNGQQLEIFTAISSSVYIEGYNQNNIYVTQCYKTPLIFNYDTGWWWKATKNSLVYTTSFSSTNCTGKVIEDENGPCFFGWNVPQSYPGTYYTLNLDAYDC